ncbi:MAG: ATP-dependent Clp protease proteolytic subunit [Turneriella sp.]|nr:ATP-dependent Clp protease proteolytic subunit [Turneriella sp.]
MLYNPFDKFSDVTRFRADDDDDDDDDHKKDKNKEKEKENSTSLGERLAERFLDNRQIFLWGTVTDRSAQSIVERMLFLESNAPGKPIYFFINSPGGVITSGMAIYDVMKMISSPVYTITMGMAASMGAILLTVGEKGHRYVFEHAKVMIHQPLISGQIIAPALDIKIQAEEIKKTRNELNRIIAETTGQPLSRIEKDTDRDYYLDGKGAVEYGLADKVLTSFSQLGLYTTEKETKKEEKKKSKKS